MQPSNQSLHQWANAREDYEIAIKRLHRVIAPGTSGEDLGQLEAMLTQPHPVAPVPYVTVFAMHQSQFDAHNHIEGRSSATLQQCPYAIVWATMGTDDGNGQATAPHTYIRFGYHTLAEAADELTQWYHMTDGGCTYSAAIVDTRVAPAESTLRGTIEAMYE
jgi:hypothetical protein